MSFLPLTLGVGSPDTESGGAKPPSKTQAEQILKRDDHSCRFCGFRSTQYQRIVPTADGFVTACSFCELVIDLQRAGLMGAGVLIWLPEMTQAELNHIVRAIYIARAEANSEDGGSDMAIAATRALDALMTRRAEAKKRLGSDDPLLLAIVLQENMTAAERKGSLRKLEGIRLVPLEKHMVRTRDGDVNGFSRIVNFWRSANGPYAKLPSSEWQSLFDKVAA